MKQQAIFLETPRENLPGKYLTKTTPKWGQILDKHKHQGLPYTAEDDGIMLFKHTDYKKRYDRLSKADRPSIWDAPELLLTHKSKPNRKQHPTRPLFNMGIESLESLFSENRQNPTQLAVLQNELQHRSTARARRLLSQVQEQLSTVHSTTVINTPSNKHKLKPVASVQALKPPASSQEQRTTPAEKPIAHENNAEVCHTIEPSLFSRLANNAKSYLHRWFNKEPQPEITQSSAPVHDSLTATPHTAAVSNVQAANNNRFSDTTQKPLDDAPSPVYDNSAYASLAAELHKHLTPQDHRILLARAIQQQKFDEIGKAVNLSRQAVRKRDTQLVNLLAEQHKQPLMQFTSALDQMLDDHDDEAELSIVIERLQLSESRLKVLLHIAQPHLKKPCQYDGVRVYRLVELLS